MQRGGDVRLRKRRGRATVTTRTRAIRNYRTVRVTRSMDCAWLARIIHQPQGACLTFHPKRAHLAKTVLGTYTRPVIDAAT